MVDDRTREHCLTCNAPVRRWRECGRRPCELVLAYCAEHGGEDRAGWEMAAHITTEHEQLRLHTPGPQSQADGFTRGYWVDLDERPVREENDAEFRQRIKDTLGIR